MINLNRLKINLALLALTSLLTLFSFKGFAQTFNFEVRELSEIITGESIVQNGGLPTTIDVTPPEWSMIGSLGSSWGSVLKFKSIQSYVKFYIKHPLANKVTTPYTFKLSYQLKGYTNPLDSNVYTTIADTLVISYSPDSLATYQDIAVKRHFGFHKIKVTLIEMNEITGVGSTPIQLDLSNVNFTRTNFAVEAQVITQPFIKQVKVGTSNVLAYGATAPALQVNKGVDTNDVLPIKWNIAGNNMDSILKLTPVNYELEWLFVDNYKVNPDNGTVQEKSLSSLSYDFRNNSTRVTVNTNYFEIPLIYQKGYLVYRVRIVRPDSVQYKYPVYGVWSIGADSNSMSSLNSDHYYKVQDAHNNDSLNWQYTISFAEQGKYKHVMSYYDGMLKNRQSITRFNSNPSNLIATEQIYDQEGRPSLSILPTPIKTSEFRYQYDLSLNAATGLPYKASDFDNFSGAFCPSEDEIIDSLSSNAKSRVYYSRSNVDTVDFQKFVPDAEGYPLVQTIYSPGFEDRVDKQGGAGSPLQIGNGHATKNYYVSADQADLNRMFGLNIGLSGFYRKTVSKDPNGQLSLNYADFRGKTIASSIIGIPDTINIAIQPNPNIPDTSSFSEDHLSGMQQQVLGNSIVFDKLYFNDVMGVNYFQYLTSFTPFPTNCPGKFLSVDARYFYTVADDCGSVKVSDTGQLGVTGVLSNGNIVTANAGNQSALLEQGVHAIHKELSFSPDDVILAVDSFMSLPDNCLKTEQEFIKEEVLSRQFPCATCKTVCEELKETLMKELWPNYKNSYTVRKYGFYTDSTGVFASNNNSIFTLIEKTSGLPYSNPEIYITYDSLNNYYRYQDTCLVSLPDTVVRFGHVYTNLRALPVDTFIAIFNDEIAEALLPLHPEYCELTKCMSDTFRSMVNGIPDREIAEDLGLFYLQDIIEKDPVYQNMIDASIPSVMDSLSRMKPSGLKMDSLALLLAYCQSGDPAMFYTCAQDIYKDSVNHSIVNNPYVKDRFFNSIRMLYFMNRENFISYLTPDTAINDCPRCMPIRMTLIGLGHTFNPIDYTDPYMGNPFGMSNTYFNQINQINPTQAGQLGNMISTFTTMDSAFNAQMDSLTNNPNANFDSSAFYYLNSFTSMQNAFNTADSIYAAGNNLLIAGAIDNILQKLVNCADSVPLLGVRTKLTTLATSGQAPLGRFKPDQIRWAIEASGIALTDLCHPYLINYKQSTASDIFKFSCGANADFNNISTLLNKTPIKSALQNVGTEYTLSLNNTNPVEQSIMTRLGSNSIKTAVTHLPVLNLYTIKLYLTTPSDSNVVEFFLKTVDTGVALSQPFTLASGEDFVIEASCINSSPLSESMGYGNDGLVNIFTFYSKITKNTASGNVVYNLAGWNNAIETNSPASSNIAACVPCTEMYSLYNDFIDTMASFGINHVDHPYYNASLKNFMNYNLKRNYSLADYLPFMESCALADKHLLPMQTGYATLYFNTNSNVNAFLQNMSNAIDSSIEILPYIQWQEGVGSGNFGIVIEFQQLPEKNWKKYKDYIGSFSGGGLVSKMTNQTFHNVGGSSFLAWIITPQALTPTQINELYTATGLAVTNAGTINWFNGNSYQAVNSVEVTSSITNPIAISKGLDTLQKYFYQQGLNAYVFNRYQSTVNYQYYLPEKIDYLAYQDSYIGESRSKVLDKLSPLNLQQNITAFSGKSLSYGTIVNPSDVQNLYFIDPIHDTIQSTYGILNTIFNQTSLHFGNNQIFTTSQKTVIQPNGKFNVYRNSDNSYWYRYFDTNNKLYNVYVIPPRYLNATQLKDYHFEGLEILAGDTGSMAFKLTVKKTGGAPETIVLRGYTDFKIGRNNSLESVLLPDPLNNPEGDDLMNCERYKLLAAIYEGQVRYIHYRDSVRNKLINDFTAYLLGGFQESLVSSYKTQRFNYTIYEYDRAQNLIRTIPPAGVKFLTGSFLNNVDNMRNAGSNDLQYLPDHKKPSNYEYNSLNQVVYQNTPDGGSTHFFYDAAGRAVFSQNAKQQTDGYMTYTLYDAQSRIMETGQAKIGCTPYFAPYKGNNDSLLNHSCAYLVGDIVSPYPPQVQNLKSYGNIEVVNYVRSLIREDVVLTQYDSASVQLSASSGMSPQEHLRKRVASIKFFSALQPSNTTFSDYNYAMHFSYDIAGNVKTLTRDYPYWAPSGQRFKRVDYDYDLISGKVNMLSYNRSFADQFYQKYDYDADNRITEVYSSQDGIIWARDAGYQYYQHGPLARMSLGELRVQGVDYAYTIQGWLKSINGDILTGENDMGGDGVNQSVYAKDAAALSIDYFNGDYKPIGNTKVTLAPSASKNLYNGNISRTSVAIKPFENLSTSYTYDQLNRLMKAAYANLEDSTLTPTNNYYNSYAYDPDGNIQKLVRNGNNPGTLAMDSIVYRYTANNDNNRLLNINDYAVDNYSNDIKYNTVTGVSRYLYDPTGNLVKDLVSGQDTIQWNHYNKVTQVVQNTGDTTILRFDYDGSGQRYMKTKVSYNADTTIEKGEYYVRDAQGNILATYSADTRYELSPTTVWTTIIEPAITQVGPSMFISNFLVPAYSQNAGFTNYMTSKGVEIELDQYLLNNHPASYFLSSSQALYVGFISSVAYSKNLLGALSSYSVVNEQYPLARALYHQSQKSDDLNFNLINALYGEEAQEDIKGEALKAIWADPSVGMGIFESLGLVFESGEESANIEALTNFLQDGQSEAVLQLSTSISNRLLSASADTAEALGFYTSLAGNTILNSREAFETNPQLLELYQMALSNESYQSEMGAFADTWEDSKAAIEQTSGASTILGAVYATHPESYITCLNTQSSNGNAVLFGGINAAYNGSILPNLNNIQNELQQYLQYQIPITVWQTALKYQNLNLSSHHIYGSSRLGTKDYLTGQYAATVDLTGSQPVMDTMALTARRPWYSLEYQDMIGGLSISPWGMTDQGSFQVASQIGQKQYEFSNHLGNVQATISDLPYLRGYPQEGTDVLKWEKDPALPAAYDYFPFGMLMPGRYISDTSDHCMTISRSNWTTEMADTCKPLATLASTAYLYGGSTINTSGSSIVLHAEEYDSWIQLTTEVEAGIDNSFTFNVPVLEGAEESGMQVMIIETRDNIPFVIGGGYLMPGGRKQTISFNASGNTVNLLFNGPFSTAEIEQICTHYTKSTQQTYLVEVCDESKDKYRFGFNGMEKDNELKGIGNSLDFGARIYDSRVARWLSLDPDFYKYPSQSPFNSMDNNPILLVDPSGKGAVLTQNPSTITVEATIYVYTHDKLIDAQKVASDMQNRVRILANNPVEFGENGNITKLINLKYRATTEVTFKVDIKPISYEEALKMAKNNSDYSINFMELKSTGYSQVYDNGNSGGVNVTDFYNRNGTTIMHEFGHLLNYLLPENLINKHQGNKYYTNDDHAAPDEHFDIMSYGLTYRNEIRDKRGKDIDINNILKNRKVTRPFYDRINGGKGIFGFPQGKHNIGNKPNNIINPPLSN